MKNYINSITKITLASLLILSPFTSVMGMENGPKKGQFERGSGYWSNLSDESKKGFFEQLTEPKSQREDWYKMSPYIAEFWCAVSNIGFMYVGLKHGSPALLAAGTASAISHSIPKQWLLTADKIGVLLVLAESAKNYDVILKNPWMLAPLIAAGGINAIDAYLARYKGKTWPHVVWHLSAAALADIFLTYAKAN